MAGMTTLSSPDLIEPIRVSVRVRRDVESAFDIFTGELTKWWPLDRFTHGPGRSKEILLDPFVGGRFYERFADGEEYTVGDVLAWDRPSLVAFTWRNASWIAPTEVHVRFIAEETMLTRVELEHRAWERLAAGRESRDEYANGWPTVLRYFAGFAGRRV
jgi:uncharacterized protein YndB with AHSA1/START domain